MRDFGRFDDGRGFGIRRAGALVLTGALGLASAAACSSGGTSTTGTHTTTSGSGGTGGAGGGTGGAAACQDVGGVYLPTAAAICTGVSVPLALCVEQDGCMLNVGTDDVAYAGTISQGHLEVTNAALGVTCTASFVAGQTTTVVCTASGVTVCTLPVTKQALPAGAVSACCDPAKPACSAGDRCAVAFAPGESSVHASYCTATGGSKMAGDACTASDALSDECGAGLYCTPESAPAGGSCLPLCETTADCSGTDNCRRIKETAPETGSCVATCTPFGADCDAGTQCTGAAVIGADGSRYSAPACFTIGMGALGDPCVTSGDCPAGAVCAGDNDDGPLTCKTLCDGAHACAAPQTCNGLAGPNGMVLDLGACF